LLPDKSEEVAEQLEDIRMEVLSTSLLSLKYSRKNLRRVENYLRSTGKEELNPEGIQRDFKTLRRSGGGLKTYAIAWGS